MNKYKVLFFQINYILTKTQKLLSIAVFLFSIIGALLECLGVSVIIPVVNIILQPEQLNNGIIGRVFPWIVELDYKNQVLLIIFSLIIVYLMKNIFMFFLCWFRYKYACMIQRQISVYIIKSYMSRGYEFFTNHSFGELNQGIYWDVYGLYNVLNYSYRLITDVLTTILISIFLFVIDWKMTVVMMSLVMVCICIIYLYIRNRMYVLGEDQRRYTEMTNQTIMQSIQGIKDILILRKQKYFVGKYEDIRNRAQKIEVKQGVVSECPTYIIETVSITGLMIMIAIRVISGVNPNTFLASLAALAVGAFRILPYLSKMSAEMSTITTYIPSVNAVYRDIVLAKEYEKKHPEFSIDRINVDSDENIKNKNDFDSVSLENIKFGYHDGDKQLPLVLDSINLTIQKGEAIAIIGSSGSGKSTLVDVLLGLLIPQCGNIYMNNSKITDNPDFWSKTVGYVPQNVYLYDASIKENIAFGVDPDNIEVDRLYDAIKRAELKEFVESLPNGYDTVVGDSGVRLSGGQRQRIAIARALYHNPQLLILDEATSALDNDTESAIMSAIDSLHGKITLIIVAHRLSTIKNCDRAYEVKNGKLIERNIDEVVKGV